MNESPFGNVELKFPVGYTLKIIVQSDVDDKETERYVHRVFEDLKIINTHWSKRASSKGAYICYSIEVIVSNRPTFDSMYEMLNKMNGVKYIL